MRDGRPSATAQRVGGHRLGFDRAPARCGDPAADEALARDVAGPPPPTGERHELAPSASPDRFPRPTPRQCARSGCLADRADRGRIRRSLAALCARRRRRLGRRHPRRRAVPGRGARRGGLKRSARVGKGGAVLPPTCHSTATCTRSQHVLRASATAGRNGCVLCNTSCNSSSRSACQVSTQGGERSAPGHNLPGPSPVIPELVRTASSRRSGRFAFATLPTLQPA